MRIAVVHSFYKSQEPSGENVVVDDQVRSLRASGHDVLLVTKSSDDIESPKDKIAAALTVAGLGGASPQSELETFQPDVVHAHNLFPNFQHRWTSQWGKRLVVTLHNYRPLCARATLFRDGAPCLKCPSDSSVHAVIHACYRDSRLATLPLAWATRDKGENYRPLQNARAAIALNSESARLYQRYYPHADIRQIPNFSKIQRSSHDARLNYFVYAGRLSPEKGIRRLMADWPEGRELRIYGSGPMEDEIGKTASRSRWITHHGLVSRRKLTSIVGRSMGLIIPSEWSEGIPTVALEALALGVPLLISNAVASSGDLLRYGAGESYAPGDGLWLRQAVERLVSAPDMYSRNARKCHEEYYSERSWLTNINELYSEVACTAD